MNYKIQEHKDLFNSTTVQAESIFQTKSATCTVFHLFEANSLTMFKEESDEDDHTKLFYLVLSGTVEFILPDHRIELTAFQSMTIDYGKDSVNFDIQAKEETTLLYFCTDAEQDMNTKMQELRKQIDAVERKDPYTRKHNARVSTYADMIMQLVDPTYNSDALSFAGSFHDIGKLHIDPTILHKPGKLTDEEFKIIKEHPIQSYEMLKKIAGEHVARIARQHHEKLDGSGYPDGLLEDEILPEAKVLAVADIFDALTSERAYRSRAFTFTEALSILQSEAENHKLDKNSVHALKHLIETNMIQEGKDNL